MDNVLNLFVRNRAGNRCEYCKLPQSSRVLRFPIDHIIARQHGGKTMVSNLALSCGRCNLRKGPNLAGLDPADGQLTRLFNPRLDQWAEHFEWLHTTVTGLTSIGRATIMVLMMNHEDDLEIRLQLYNLGEFPPE